MLNNYEAKCVWIKYFKEEYKIFAILCFSDNVLCSVEALMLKAPNANPNEYEELKTQSPAR